MIALFVDHDQGVDRTDRAPIDQPLPVNVRNVLLKCADVFAVELEDLGRHFHAVRRADTEHAIDADRQATYFPFDEVSDDCPSVFALSERRPIRSDPLPRSSKKAQFKFCCLGHLGRVPGGIEDDLDLGIAYAGNALCLLLYLPR